MNQEIDQLIAPLHKKVKSYSIEKFQIIDRKDYKGFFPNEDLNDYPDFSLDGMRVSVSLDIIQ